MLRRAIVRTLMLSTLTGVLIVGLLGCAVTTNRKFRNTDPSTPPRCTASRVAVVLDGAFATIYGLGAIGVAGESDGGGLLTPLVALGVTHLTSAYFGNKSARRCKKAYREHDKWLRAEATRQRRVELMEVARAEARHAKEGAQDTESPGTSAELVEANPSDQTDQVSSPDEIATAGADDAEAESPAQVETDAIEPVPAADDTPAQPPREAPPPETDEDTTESPPPVGDDVPWSDFWREINL